MKFLWVDVGVPSSVRSCSIWATCDFVLRCTSTSLESAWMLLSTYVLTPKPCSFVGRYRECGGSVWMRLNLFFSVFWTLRSMSLHRLYGGCAGSGLKLIRVFRSVLCTYAVACLERVRFMMVWSLVFIELVSLSFVGVVSPSMLRIVPKCLE